VAALRKREGEVHRGIPLPLCGYLKAEGDRGLQIMCTHDPH
jgi:hypothetical protein